MTGSSLNGYQDILENVERDWFMVSVLSALWLSLSIEKWAEVILQIELVVHPLDDSGVHPETPSDTYQEGKTQPEGNQGTARVDKAGDEYKADDEKNHHQYNVQYGCRQHKPNGVHFLRHCYLPSFQSFQGAD